MYDVNSLNKALQMIGFGRFHIRLFFLCGTVKLIQCWMQDMLSIVNVSVIMNSAGEYYNLSDQSRGFIATLFMMGMFMGSYLAGYLSDKFGRMLVFKWNPLVLILIMTSMVFSQNEYMLYVIVWMYGLGTGSELTIGGVVYQEFVPTSKQWTLVLLGTTWAAGGMFGAMVAVVLLLIQIPVQLWIGCILVNIVFITISMLCRIRQKETPRYLLMKNNIDALENTLRWVAKQNKYDIQKVFSTIGYQQVVQLGLVDALITKPKPFSVLNIWKAPYWLTTLLLSLIYILYNIGWCFINFFMPEILKDAGVSEIQAYIVMSAQEFAGILGILFASLLVRGPLGRKFTIALGTICTALLNLVFIFFSDFWILLGFTTVAQAFSMLSWSSLYTLTPESYRTDVRNFAVGWMNSCAKAGGLIGPLICGPILDVENGFEYSILVAVGVIFLTGTCSMLLKETKGRQIDDDDN